MQKYLIVIDMQNDFIDGALGMPEAVAIIPNVVECIRGAQAEGRTLLFTQDTHQPHYLETLEGRNLPIMHCEEGSHGWALHSDIAPFAGDIFTKPSFSSMALVERLQTVSVDSGANLDIELIGLCTDICVVSNALLLKAHFPEATLRVYQDACAGVTPGGHDAALTVLRACQVEIV